MKTLIRKQLAGLITAMTLLSACHQVKIEDNPTEKAKAIHVAQEFITHFAHQEFTDSMSRIAVPFWLDGRLVSSRDTLEAELKNAGKDDSKEFEVLESHFFTLPALSIFARRLLPKLSKGQFNTEDVYAVVLKVKEKGRRDEALLFLVKKLEGKWHVVGVED